MHQSILNKGAYIFQRYKANAEQVYNYNFNKLLFTIAKFKKIVLYIAKFRVTKFYIPRAQEI